MVHSSLLKKIAFPFGVVTTSFLMMGFDKAHASTTLFQPAIPFLFDKLKNGDSKGIITKIAEGKDTIQKATQTWEQIGESISGFIQWFKDIPENIVSFSITFLAKIYELLATFILQTPLFIFDNAMFTNTSEKFSIVSIFVVIILTLIEMIRKMLDKKHTDYLTILKRLPIAVITTGIAPYLFKTVFYILNKLSTAITSIGYNTIKTSANSAIGNVSIIEMLLLIAFDIGLVILLYNIAFHIGRRWFNLLACGVITPLAMTAYIFDDHKHLHSKWWDTIKSLSLIQVAYSIFLCLIGLLVFGYYTDTWNDLLVKLLLVLGGLHAMAFPPQIVLRYTDKGKNTWAMMKDVKDMVTMKNFQPAIFTRGKIKESKMFDELYSEARTKSRYVDTDAIKDKIKKKKK